MAHYLLTGAAGFIGARVAEMLLEAGHTVVGVDDMNDAYDVRLKDYRLARLQALPDFQFQRMDIADRQKVEALGEDNGPFEAIINLAARAGVRASVENPWIYLQTNVSGTLNLLELCRRQGTSKFILASTSSVYGADAPLPTPEDHNSSRPLQPYAASKKAAEVLCHSYHYLYGVDVTVFRYFTVYGPAGRPDMVMFRLTQWICEDRPVIVYGDGEQSRGFTFSDDIAQGTLMGLAPLGFEIINLGGHETITINDLVALFEARLGRRARIEHRPRHPADMLANWADVTKARRLLGWEPGTPLSAGVTHLIDWYLKERKWASQVDTT